VCWTDGRPLPFRAPRPWATDSPGGACQVQLVWQRIAISFFWQTLQEYACTNGPRIRAQVLQHRVRGTGNLAVLADSQTKCCPGIADMHTNTHTHTHTHNYTHTHTRTHTHAHTHTHIYNSYKCRHTQLHTPASILTSNFPQWVIPANWLATCHTMPSP